MNIILGVQYNEKHYMDIHKATLLKETVLVHDIIREILLIMISKDNKFLKHYIYEIDGEEHEFFGINYYIVVDVVSYKSITLLDAVPADTIIDYANRTLYNYINIAHRRFITIKLAYGIKISDFTSTEYFRIMGLINVKGKRAWSPYTVRKLDYYTYVGITIYDSDINYNIDGLTKTYKIEDYRHLGGELDDLMRLLNIEPETPPMLFMEAY